MKLDERKALSRLIRETRLSGAALYPPSKYALPPSIILGVMRKDGFRCQMHDGCTGGAKGLMVHRISDVVEENALRFARNLNDRQNLITVCRAGYEECVDPRLTSVRAHDLAAAVKRLIDER